MHSKFHLNDLQKVFQFPYFSNYYLLYKKCAKFYNLLYLEYSGSTIAKWIFDGFHGDYQQILRETITFELN